MSKIEMSRVSVDEEMRQAALRVLDGGRYVKGPEADAFGAEFAAFHQARHGIAVANGTAALHLAYLALGIAPGDEVLMPSWTFIATAAPAIHLGATPVFVDVDPVTMTMDPADLERKITPRSKAVVPVHLYGHAADMDPIQRVARAAGIPVVEDAAQAHGATYRGKLIGGIGDVSTFSFFPSKNMTVCGDGGMVVSNDDEIAEVVAMLRDQGRAPGRKYEHDLVGFNQRLSEILAAIGRVQLRHLDAWTTRRREIAARYSKALEPLAADGKLTLPHEASWAKHVYHQYVLRLPDRDGLSAHLASQGIASAVHYPLPTHRQPAIAAVVKPKPLPVTDGLATQVLSIPMHPLLSDADCDRITTEVARFVRGAR